MPSGRPLYQESLETQVAKLINRVEALERRRAVSGHYQIKVFMDDETVQTGDDAFIFVVPFDLDRSHLLSCNIYVTTASSSGLVTVQLRKVQNSHDLLSVPLTIDSGEFSAETAATPAEIDTTMNDLYAYPDPNNTVYFNDRISIDVDTAGTGAMGLGVMLGFS